MSPDVIAALKANATAPQSTSGRAVYQNGKFVLDGATKQKKTGRGGWASSLISEGLGTLGAIGGTVLMPGLGTAAGAALGSGLGNALEQKFRNEDTGVNWGSALGEGAISGALAALPVGKILKSVGKPLKGAGGLLTKRIGGEVVKDAEQQVVKTAGKEGLLSRIGKVGSELRQTVANPKVAAGVGGAQKEAEIAARIGKVPGLSAKGKYGNLGSEVENLTAKIEPILSKSKGTVGGDDLFAGIRKSAEDSSHFLVGDTAYEKQLTSVLNDLTAKTGGAKQLTAKQLFDYKKGLDVDSVFKKLAKGADLNAKEASRLAVWGSLDDAITKAAPGVKLLTKEQSLLIQGASGLKAASTKTAGVPLLGIKSQGVERVLQGTRELSGRALQAVGGAGAAVGGAGQVTKAGGQSVGGLLTRVAGADLLNPDPPQEEPLDLNSPDPALDPSLDPSLDSSLDPTLDPSQTDTADSNDIYSPANVKASINSIIEQGGSQKDIASYLDNFKMMQEIDQLSGGKEQKPLNSTAAKTVSDMQTGLASVGELAQSYKDSNANSPFTGWLRSKNPLDTNAKGLQAQTALVKQLIGKALEGGVLRKEDEIKYAKILPTLNDTDENALNKLRYIKTNLERSLNLYTQNLGGGGGGADLASLGAIQ